MIVAFQAMASGLSKGALLLGVKIMSSINLYFKKGLVIFWALWWLIALWTDIVGVLSHLGIIQASWAPDTNFPFLVSSLAIYHSPVWLAWLFIIGILSWSFVSSAAFVMASFCSAGSKQVWLKWVNLAFVISLGFWLAFFLADQMVMKFDLEQNHMVQGGFELLTFLAIHLLPEC